MLAGCPPKAHTRSLHCTVCACCTLPTTRSPQSQSHRCARSPPHQRAWRCRRRWRTRCSGDQQRLPRKEDHRATHLPIVGCRRPKGGEHAAGRLQPLPPPRPNIASALCPMPLPHPPTVFWQSPSHAPTNTVRLLTVMRGQVGVSRSASGVQKQQQRTCPRLGTSSTRGAHKREAAPTRAPACCNPTPPCTNQNCAARCAHTRFHASHLSTPCPPLTLTLKVCKGDDGHQHAHGRVGRPAATCPHVGTRAGGEHKGGLPDPTSPFAPCN